MCEVIIGEKNALRNLPFHFAVTLINYSLYKFQAFIFQSCELDSDPTEAVFISSKEVYVLPILFYESACASHLHITD